MHEIIKTNNPKISKPINCINYSAMTVQMSVSAKRNDTPVEAVVILEGSIDGIGWFTIAELSSKGVGYSADGGSFETLWSYIRANVKKVSQQSTVTVYLAKRG